VRSPDPTKKPGPALVELQHTPRTPSKDSTHKRAQSHRWQLPFPFLQIYLDVYAFTQNRRRKSGRLALAASLASDFTRAFAGRVKRMLGRSLLDGSHPQSSTVLPHLTCRRPVAVIQYLYYYKDTARLSLFPNTRHGPSGRPAVGRRIRLNRPETPLKTPGTGGRVRLRACLNWSTGARRRTGIRPGGACGSPLRGLGFSLPAGSPSGSEPELRITYFVIPAPRGRVPDVFAASAYIYHPTPPTHPTTKNHQPHHHPIPPPARSGPGIPRALPKKPPSWRPSTVPPRDLMFASLADPACDSW